jgi:hypothetical protein
VRSGGGIQTSGVAGGGGPTTMVSGSGVTFLFAASSPGFVSTAEVASINLSAPAAGGSTNANGKPVLFDVDNPSGYVHLDGAAGKTQFTGMVYQTSSATGGGVDIDPGRGPAATHAATLVGQVIAYRLAVFGAGSGAAVDFSGYWNTGFAPPSGSSQEGPMISLPANALQAGSAPGTDTLHVEYDDESMLDAYDLSLSVNGQKTYFSAGLWGQHPPNPPHPPGQPAQGPNLFPSDNNPMLAQAGQVSGLVAANKFDKPTYTYLPALPNYDASIADIPIPGYTWVSSSQPPELKYTDPSGTIVDVSGDWMWGNSQNLVLAGDTLAGDPRSDLYSADIKLTFPAPAGKTVKLSLYAVDGDNCGDGLGPSWTVFLPQTGNPAPGPVPPIAVQLVQ